MLWQYASLQAPFANAYCLITAVQHDLDFQSEDGERRQLRTAFSCLSSISMCQRQFTISSLFLTSPFRGCLSHWELRSNVIPLKETWKYHHLLTEKGVDWERSYSSELFFFLVEKLVMNVDHNIGRWMWCEFWPCYISISSMRILQRNVHLMSILNEGMMLSVILLGCTFEQRHL